MADSADMATILDRFLISMPSPLVFIVAGYIGLRSLEVAFRPPEACRTRTAYALMTISAIGLFLAAVLFGLAEILRAAGVVTPPWPPGKF